MTISQPFSPRTLSASEYVLALHAPEDRIAVVVRNRVRAQTMQRILTAETIASPLFMYWLNKQNEAGADVFLGMNPIKENSHSRTKENIREIHHVYLDLDEGEKVLARFAGSVSDFGNMLLHQSAIDANK
jgi:hypothetical protein